MGILDTVMGVFGSRPRADAGPYALTDPRLVELLSFGTLTASGLNVSVEKAMRNPAMFRAVTLVSGTMAMLPVNLIDEETKDKAKDHPVHRVLRRRPNPSQTSFDFRGLMQYRALVKSNAYARIVRSPDITKRGAPERVIALLPLDPDRVESALNPDWTVRYAYQPPQGPRVAIRSEDMFHLRGLSFDGLNGVSLVRQAAEAIGLALSAELASAKVFRNGSFVEGTLNAPAGLNEGALKRLKESWNARYGGAVNAGKTPLLEEGVEYKLVGSSAKDAQMVEIRRMQVEEIGRVTGVPRPLLMMDETNWGTGIEALGRFFVQYALNPWFEAWQQAAERALLTEAEGERYAVRFNPGALLRGSLKDQADFFAKALGSGGHQPWMHPDEIRDVLDLPARDDLPPAPSQPASLAGHNGGPPLDDDETKPAPKKARRKDPNDDDD